MNPVRVKICCISSEEEAKLAIRYGASALGLVGKMPSGPGVISDSMINAIAKLVPPPISTFLLTSVTSAQGIIDHYRRAHTSTIQIVDALEDKQYEIIRQALPAVKIVQVIHVRGAESVADALEIGSLVDAILLDSGNPTLSIKQLGGTGRTHNWQLSAEICSRAPVPVFLAGGLSCENITEAIETVHPFGIDICSGVRTGGHLDEGKLREFFRIINSIRDK